VTTLDDHERLREDLAGYVLGGLTPDEQRALEAHLAECTACRAELAELDPVPVLLDLAAPAAEAATPEPEVGEEPALVVVGAAPTTTPQPAPRRRHRRPVLASAGLAVAMVLAFAVGIFVASPSEPAYGAPIALHPVGGSPASGTIAVRAGDHGTDVRLRLDDLPSSPDTWYECVWWSASGGRWSAGTFRPAPANETDVELLAAAKLHPGWSVAILEHVTGHREAVTVLKTSA